MTFSGTIIALPQTEQLPCAYKATLSATNVSGRPILLLITTVQIRENEGEGEETSNEIPPFLTHHKIDDYFFQSDVFGAAATKNWEELLDYPARGPAKVTAAGGVTFIQFADGTTWGDAQAAQNTLRDRAASVSKLRDLLQVYDTKSEEEFLAALRQPSTLLVVSALQYRYCESNGSVQVVIDKLKSLLKAAVLHQSSLTGVPTKQPQGDENPSLAN